MTTIVFAGGGSGGHLFPGVAVAEELRRIKPHCEIAFVGSDRSIEIRILEPFGFRHRSLSVPRLRSLLRFPLATANSFWKAYHTAVSIIREMDPAVVVGLGGGYSAPTVLAASRRSIPIILLEQNAVLGRANRFLLPFANRLCLSFPQTRVPSRYAAITSVTGNPLRREIVSTAVNDFASESNGLLVLGGSQGAMSLNEVVLQALSPIKDLLYSWRLIHQTGVEDVSRVKAAYAELGITASVVPFLDNISSIYSRTTLAITRGGGTTLAELAMHSIPPIIVPYPGSIRNHQTLNAQAYERAVAARHVPQLSNTKLTANCLCEALVPLLSDRGLHSSLGRSMFSMASANAAHLVAEMILGYFPLVSASSTGRLLNKAVGSEQ